MLLRPVLHRALALGRESILGLEVKAHAAESLRRIVPRSCK